MTYIKLPTYPTLPFSQLHVLSHPLPFTFLSITNSMTSLPDHPPPTTTSYVLATAILCLAGGYLIGQASSLGLFSSSSKKKSWPNSYDVTVHPDSSDEELMTHLNGGGGKGIKDSKDEESSEGDGEGEDGELKAFGGNREECKLILVVRTDLGMGKGKVPSSASPQTSSQAHRLNSSTHQVKSPPNVPTQLSPATSISSATHRRLRCSNAGNLSARRK